MDTLDARAELQMQQEQLNRRERQTMALKPYYQDDYVTLYHGDCREIVPQLPDNSVDAVVTDPPYGIRFMGRRWDYDVPSVETWAGCLRLLKPGGHLLAFASTRTHHRMVCRIEDAGFEIRDMIAWISGSNFPKGRKFPDGTATQLKPALEPITLARKPFTGSVAANVDLYGTGVLNVDPCRIESEPFMKTFGSAPPNRNVLGQYKKRVEPWESHPAGRWPANVAHDGSEEVLALFPESKGGSAARFFFCACASPADRGHGNAHPTVKPTALMRWLCRLVTPAGGVILDPFMGSGSTGKAAVEDGLRFIGIERERESFEIAAKRMAQGVLPLEGC